MKCKHCGHELESSKVAFTLEIYKSCFQKDDGTYVKNSPPCIHCTEEKFAECLKRQEGCDEFKIIARNRGWDRREV